MTGSQKSIPARLPQKWKMTVFTPESPVIHGVTATYLKN
jgi:hypothetical protein